MATDKDTIYVDIDDEITGIIDKLKASDGKVVALVLPKRASVFQSIVNMKLLKRAADSSKKNAVLITSEAGLLPLAGAAGLHVAKSLTSKPEIPVGPSMAEDAEETVDESEADEPTINPDQTVGELAGAGAAAVPPTENGMETIALDDEELPPEAVTAATPKTFEPPKSKKDKKLKIPDFNRFRLLLILGALILILLVIGIVMAAGFSKATINIKTDATNVNVNQNLGLSTSARTAASDGSSVPAKLEQLQKTYTQQVPTTGQKNNGNKASGSVTMSGQTCGTIPNGNPTDVPAGTGVSANGQTYITQQDTTFSYNGGPKKGCLPFQADNPTPITAQSAGAGSNTPNGTSFSVAGRSDISASGSASGGTDNIVQSVNQNDINSAKSKISTNDTAAKQSVESQTRSDGYYPIEATFTTGTPNVTSSAQVGDVASTVTVTETVNYTIFGVHQSDLKTILTSNINSQIDSSKQNILDDGLGSAVFIVNSQSATGASLSMSTKAVVGPQLNTQTIKTAAAGQKAGAIKGQLSSNPDVTSVDVHFSPFWVSSAPKKTSRIVVNIAKPTTTKSSKSNAATP